MVTLSAGGRTSYCAILTALVMAKLPGDLTVLLRRMQQGHRVAEPQVFTLVNEELRRFASALLASERPEDTLQPTALINQTVLDHLREIKAEIQDRAHFFLTAAKAMRRVLGDHARKRNARNAIRHSIPPRSRSSCKAVPRCSICWRGPTRRWADVARPRCGASALRQPGGRGSRLSRRLTAIKIHQINPATPPHRSWSRRSGARPRRSPNSIPPHRGHL